MINGGALGSQVGVAFVDSISQASLWTGSGSSWVSLNPQGAQYSTAFGSSSGQQVGYASISDSWHASLWTGTAASWVDLNPFPGEYSVANATDNNQQVGYARHNSAERACVWSGTAASWVDLSSGSAFSEAYTVKNGVQGGHEDFLACIWRGTAASKVALSPPGDDGSAVRGIGGDQQVGYVRVGGRVRASLWRGTAESWVDLSPLDSIESVAYDATKGQQVGYSDVASGACLWAGTPGSHVSLQAYLPSNYHNSRATSIVCDGIKTVIGGWAYNSNAGREEAILWIADDFDLTLNKTAVAGQNSVLGTVSIGEPKPTNTTFSMSDNSSLVLTPSSVTVQAGQLSKSFQVATTAIISTVVTTIYAKLGKMTRPQTLTLIPLVPTALSFTPTQVSSGQPTICRVVINGVAGPGGRTLSISDNSIYSTVPSTIIVPAGASSVSFPITTTTVSQAVTVRVTARVSAGEKTGTFRIVP
ncbi:MAG: hypothetical protein ABL949_08725 [Fimbriimonadaceae bacterium]